jgi:ribosomal protein L11 methylase PrmA
VKKWKEVKVAIPKEAGEVVANFLMERGSSGVVFEDTEDGNSSPGFAHLI